jgi:hypothetical protein
MYNLILITTQAFLGQYATLDHCNKAIRDIYYREVIPYPHLVGKNDMPILLETVDMLVKLNKEYVCVKVNK